MGISLPRVTVVQMNLWEAFDDVNKPSTALVSLPPVEEVATDLLFTFNGIGDGQRGHCILRSGKFLFRRWKFNIVTCCRNSNELVNKLVPLFAYA